MLDRIVEKYIRSFLLGAGIISGAVLITLMYGVR